MLLHRDGLGPGYPIRSQQGHCDFLVFAQINLRLFMGTLSLYIPIDVCTDIYRDLFLRTGESTHSNFLGIQTDRGTWISNDSLVQVTL